ncbi:hypothetical protein JX265_009422 [Neoarthrinium moseri]|uniref:Geranylgeranyl transferase type-2 subunit alpha n=1 Tax=Neoarthrinium moseri TaxID=1658444 RepID=A0A9P9WGN1_9PEZI|nr:hypothetical protein JX266_011990 [Neoarthrinium moseri]KAI1861919.1 hypothetical protein JX265_009422 [Neoarthrinium moseri]
MASAGGSHGIARTARRRTDEQRQQDLDRIAKYRGLEDQIREQAKAHDYASPALFDLTTRLLRLNPEYYTTAAWVMALEGVAEYISERHYETAFRRLLALVLGCDPARPKVPATYEEWAEWYNNHDESTKILEDAGAGRNSKNVANDASVLQSELAFTIPLLIEFPKCYWIWNHRSYILSLCIELLPVSLAREVWTAELGLVTKMLTKDRRNFHAWSYRRRVVARLESDVLDGKSMAEQEFMYTTKMVNQDLSNFSAWHNRSQLAPRVLDERKADHVARKVFMEAELNLAREALNVGPDDQSLWYYHQFLMSQILPEYKCGARSWSRIAPDLTLEERTDYVKREIEEIRDLLEDYKDVKWIYEALLEYSIALDGMCKDKGTTRPKQELTEEAQTWLETLRQLDPLRKGRWDDFAQTG